jgi:hypothetical protein
MQCCGSGSGRIRIILPDPDRYQGHADSGSADPNRYHVWYRFQTNDEVDNYIFSSRKIPSNLVATLYGAVTGYLVPAKATEVPIEAALYHRGMDE